jgi:hypothetical protein
VRLSNCTLKRFGAVNDGGYLLCENFTGEARSVYSYGIDGRDEWAATFRVRITCPFTSTTVSIRIVRSAPARTFTSMTSVSARVRPASTSPVRFGGEPDRRNGDTGKHLL